MLIPFHFNFNLAPDFANEPGKQFNCLTIRLHAIQYLEIMCTLAQGNKHSANFQSKIGMSDEYSLKICHAEPMHHLMLSSWK